MSIPTDMTAKDPELNDATMRLIGIPGFGVVIPHVTGLFGDLTYANSAYWFGHVFFILLAYLIWHGNRYLLFRTRKRFTWFDKPVEKLILLLMNNVFYTSPLTIAWLCVWYHAAGFGSVDWPAIQMVVLINVICVLFVTHVYETVFMVKEQQTEQLNNAHLHRAKAEAELAALKNQIDPHFMFNSLNSLSYLIATDPVQAALFTDNLAEIYRYILGQKERSLVLLEDEMTFTQRYTDLLHIRFGNSFTVRQNFSNDAGKQFLIPPTSVFVAFENVVKHNELSHQSPLEVSMDLLDHALVIRNPLRRKKHVGHSSGIGLRNLNERFMITTGKQLMTGSPDGVVFEVTLPLIPLEPAPSVHTEYVDQSEDKTSTLQV